MQDKQKLRKRDVILLNLFMRMTKKLSKSSKTLLSGITLWVGGTLKYTFRPINTHSLTHPSHSSLFKLSSYFSVSLFSSSLSLSLLPFLSPSRFSYISLSLTLTCPMSNSSRFLKSLFFLVKFGYLVVLSILFLEISLIKLSLGYVPILSYNFKI